MLSIKELDQQTKDVYNKTHPLNDNRLSNVKHNFIPGFAVPELYELARSGQTEVLRVLINKTMKLEHGNRAVIDRRCTVTGRTLLHEASINGHKQTIDMLCHEFKAVVDCKTLMGADTPLHLAASRNRRQICFTLLCSYKADPDARNKHGFTPVHYAAMYGGASTVKTLITYGGKARAITKDGRTAANLAFERGAGDPVVEQLIEFFTVTSRIDRAFVSSHLFAWSPFA